MTPLVNPDEGLPLGLPVGWKRGTIADIANVEMGQSPPSVTYNKEGVGLPFFQGKADFGDLYATPRVWCSAPGKIAGPDDILLSVRAPVGPTNLAPAECCIGRGLAAIRPEPGISLRFLLYAFRRFERELGSLGTGTTFRAISGKQLRSLVIPVAPAGEQVRIAEGLDDLFSRLDSGVIAMRRALGPGANQAGIGVLALRQAILRDAFAGRLVPQDPQDEPVSALLGRIAADRKSRGSRTKPLKRRATRPRRHRTGNAAPVVARDP